MATQSKYVKSQIRIPHEIHKKVVQLARNTERSMNGEIVHLIEIGIRTLEEIEKDSGTRSEETSIKLNVDNINLAVRIDELKEMVEEVSNKIDTGKT